MTELEKYDIDLLVYCYKTTCTMQCTNVSQHTILDNLIKPNKPNLKMNCTRILKFKYIKYSIKTDHSHHELQLFMLCSVLFY